MAPRMSTATNNRFYGGIRRRTAKMRENLSSSGGDNGLRWLPSEEIQQGLDCRTARTFRARLKCI